ncbi:hypothetical protein P3T27_000918 [Kitasatospora sp. MAA19]|uniref:hypothetical protein n=1 Tax=unclassified Kitasatospora TaxID=2633591 RepID=UPI002475F515|nr:hypothetical protein [Kitasatospora sp. MAA19]MDH6704217.1 hypothetical protein [Kitasatospora sp. MAA19]
MSFRVDQVLSEPRGPKAAETVEDNPSGPAAQQPVRAVVAGSIVPVWQDGLNAAVLAPDYQRIVNLLADRRRSGDEAAMSCQQLAGVLGLEVVPAKVEGVRSKAKRLVARGWLMEESPGRFSIPDVPGGGS